RQLSGLAHDLRPSVLDHLGLVAALRSYGREFEQRFDLRVALSVRGTVPRLRPDAETAAFRIVQEALTNVAKHAQARRVAVLVRASDGEMRIEVDDDGRGFDPAALH